MSVKLITGETRLAQKYFPRIIQEFRSPTDLIVPISFGDFFPEARPTVYYAASESETDFYLLYCFYHYKDYSTLPAPLKKLDSHRHDFEGVLVVGPKREGGVVYFTRSHYEFKRGVWFDPHPPVVIRSGGHAIEPKTQVEAKGNFICYTDAALLDMRSKSFQNKWEYLREHFAEHKVTMPDEWNDIQTKVKFGKRTDGLIWRDPEEFVKLNWPRTVNDGH